MPRPPIINQGQVAIAVSGSVYVSTTKRIQRATVAVAASSGDIQTAFRSADSRR